MITKTALARALLLVDKDKRAPLPFACPTTPGWLWAGPWAVCSNKMEAARVEGGEVAGLAAELRTIIGECQAPAWVADPVRYAEMMRKRSSRAGDFHAKVCGFLDRAESAERKRGSAARKAIP
jgi:hypothetical protein